MISSTENPICINCGAAFNPENQNPFDPFNCSFHPGGPKSIGNTGPWDDFAELWYFPWCGKRELGKIDRGNDITPQQSPGCINTFHRCESLLIFISYSRQDRVFAQFLEAELKRRGHSMWIDTTDIVGGDAWREMIQKAIRDCGLVLLLVSPASLTSAEVHRELEYARLHEKRILPILIADCELPEQIKSTQLIDWRPNEASLYSHHFETIKDAIRHTISTLPEAGS